MREQVTQRIGEKMNRVKITRSNAIAGLLLLGALVLCTGMGSGYSSVDTPSSENGEKIGVLVIAHGTPSEGWCGPVREAVEDVSLPYPIELGFLEFVPNKTIGDAVERLDEDGVNKIIAVPLFVSSYSSHIQEIEYILGLRATPPGDEELERVETSAEITLTKTMDDHSLVGYILADRTVELSEDPGNETVVIISHGTEDEAGLATQINNQDWLAGETKKILKWWMDPSIKIKDIRYAFIHLNETSYPDLTTRSVVENASLEGDVIVLPLMISEGFFTARRIPQLLEGLSYRYDGKALASHPNVARWIETKVRCAIGHETYGVLIVDHGSSKIERVNAVRELVDGVELDVPVALAFAEHPPENESIPMGISKLLEQGANRIIVVTLFTAPTTDHDDACEEVYRALEDLEETRLSQVAPVHMGIRITTTGPIDDHPLIAGAILDRAREVSENEDQETLVICRWGDSRYFEYSDLYSRSLAEQIRKISNFDDVRYGFMGCQGSPNIILAVEEAAQYGPVVVVTTNSLGSDYVDNLISQKLEGLDYTYNGKGFYGYPGDLDPHPNIARWIEFTASKEMNRQSSKPDQMAVSEVLGVEMAPCIP